MVVAHDDFDPLVDLYGRWTTEYAEAYLPIPAAAPGTSYECVDGYLIMSPYEGTANVHAAYQLHRVLERSAEDAGYRVYGTTNVVLAPNRWIQPDLVVLRTPIKALTWIPADNVLLAAEMVSRSSRRRDRVDKPKLCADAGIPFYLRVEISEYDAAVELLRLDGDKYVSQARGFGGLMLRADLPFPLEFDPVDLLEY
jgi:hypothetical protein